MNPAEMLDFTEQVRGAEVVLAVDPASGVSEAVWGRDLLEQIARSGESCPVRVLRIPTTRPEQLADLVAEIKARPKAN